MLPGVDSPAGPPCVVREGWRTTTEHLRSWMAVTGPDNIHRGSPSAMLTAGSDSGGGMASVDDVGRRIAAVADQLPLQALQDAAEALAAAHDALAAAGAGSADSELAEAIAWLAQAHAAAVECAEECRSIAGAMQALVAKLSGGAPAPSPSPASQAGGSGATATPAPQQPAGGAPLVSAPDGKRLSREEAATVATTLPPPVPRPNTSGQKTHGRWFDEHGQAQAITSGQDDDSAKVWETLQQLDIPVAGPPTAVSDVEQKLAVRMVQDGRRHVDVVINNLPCVGRFGCDALVPVILPAGYSLTVHGPNYRKTYTGGAKPWWR